MPSLLTAMQSINRPTNTGATKEASTNGMSGFVQSATDPAASVYAPLHLQRLGVS